MSQYEKLLVLGTRGTVSLVKNRTTSFLLIIKKFECLDETKMRKEFAQLKNMKHPHLPELHDFINYEGKPAIVSEFCNEDLQTYLLQRNGNLLSEEQIWTWMYQMGSALKYLHGCGITHGGIKPQNVLLSNNSVKLTDCRFRQALEVCDSPSNDSPLYSPQSDIRALGCVVQNMYTLTPSCDTPPDNVSENYSDELTQLVMRMKSSEPSVQPSAKDIVKIAKEKMGQEYRQTRSQSPSNNCVACGWILTTAHQTSCGCYICKQCVTRMRSTGHVTMQCPGGTSECAQITPANLRPDLNKMQSFLQCPFSFHCDEVISLSYLKAHYYMCKHTPDLCKYCYHKFPRQYLHDAHLNKRSPECSYFNGPCHFCHIGSFDRHALHTHSLTCSQWEMQCSFHRMGCEVEGDCYELTEHYNASHCAHWMMLNEFMNKHRISSTNVWISQIMQVVQSIINYRVDRELIGYTAPPSLTSLVQSHDSDDSAVIPTYAQNKDTNQTPHLNEEDIPLSIDAAISLTMRNSYNDNREEYAEIQSPNPFHNCVSCRYILITAYQTSCGCYICKQCVIRMRFTGHVTMQCPGRTRKCGEITPANIRLDVGKTRDLLNETIWCPYCVFCKQLILLSALRRHYHTTHAVVSCKYCKEPFPRKFLEDEHLNKRTLKCACFIGPCAFCHTGSFDRETLATHALTCANWTLQCRYHEFGCEFEGAYQQLQEHYHMNYEFHVHMRVSSSSNYSKAKSLIRFVTGAVEMSGFNQPNMNNILMVNALRESLAEEKARSWPDGKLILRVTQFSHKMTQATSDNDFFIASESFYTRQYKMRLILYRNQRFVAIDLQFIPGCFDDCVEWPVNHGVRIELYNNHGRKHNKSVTISAVPTSPKWQRPKTVYGNPVITLPSILNLKNVQESYLHGDNCLSLTCQLIC